MSVHESHKVHQTLNKAIVLAQSYLGYREREKLLSITYKSNANIQQKAMYISIISHHTKIGYTLKESQHLFFLISHDVLTECFHLLLALSPLVVL